MLAPSTPLAARGSTKDWTERIAAFLVPEGEVGLEITPELVEVQAGTFDLDDLALVSTDPAPVAARLTAQVEAARAAIVPPEPPDKARWPAELHVQGNRLVNSEGKEVWLRRVCVDGWETAPLRCLCDEGGQGGRRGLARQHRARASEERFLVRPQRTPAGRRCPLSAEPGRPRDDGGQTGEPTCCATCTATAHRRRSTRTSRRTRQHTTWTIPRCSSPVQRAERHLVGNLAQLQEDPGRENLERRGGLPQPGGESEAGRRGPSVGMQGLVDVVRSTGAHNVLVAGGLAYANDLSGVVNGYALDDLGGHGIVYSWHCYNWHKGWEQHLLGAAARYPILVGECGVEPMKMDFIPAEAQEDYTTWAPDMLGFLQKYRLNWTGFCMHPRSSPRMLMD